jgi:hypothetical protein
MCAPRVTQHTSIRYSSSCHTHVAMVGSTQYLSPLPRDLADLKARIIAAVKNIDAPMFTRVWQELEFRIDVCCVTRGAHIEHL